MSGQHERPEDRCCTGCTCACGDTPSPGWRPPEWMWATPADLRLVHDAITASEKAFSRKLDKILKEIHTMAVSTDKLVADIATLIAGYQAVVTERDALKAALAAADATQAQAVADAIAADDADAQAKIDAADAVVDAVNNPPAPVEPPA